MFTLQEFSIAYRFLKKSYNQKSISSLVKICFFTILLSTITLTIITFIMNGFEKETYKTFKGINSDIIIRSQNRSLDEDKIAKVLKIEFQKDVSAYSPNSTAQVILQFYKNNSCLQTLMVLKAIDPEKESQVNSLKINFIKENSIFIGKSLAAKLELKLNDKIALLYPTDQCIQNKIELGQSQAFISGIFSTGIEDYDEHVLYTDFKFFNKIFDTGIREINLKLIDNTNEKDVLDKLKQRFSPLEVNSWKDLYPAIVSALSLEKYVMIIIAALIMLIASINAISLVYIFIVQKRMELAILKANGFKEKSIINICILASLLISIPANLIAILIAILISVLLIIFKIPLPSSYYVQYVPIYITLNSIVYVALFSFLVSFITAYLGSRKIKNLSLIETIKKRN